MKKVQLILVGETADVQAALTQLQTDVSTLLTNVSAALQKIPTTDPATVAAIQAIDKTVTDFNTSLTATPPAPGA